MGTNTSSLTTSFLTPNNHDPLMDGDIIQHVSVKRDLLDVLAAKTNSQTGMIFKGDVWITPPYGSPYRIVCETQHLCETPELCEGPRVL